MRMSSGKGKQKQEEPTKDGLELQEYVFDGKTLRKYASKEDLLNTYRKIVNKTFNETVRLYDEIRQLPRPSVTLKAVRNHTTDTLRLAMSMGNKVSEVRVNLGLVPTPDIINLNREPRDILNTRLLRPLYIWLRWSLAKLRLKIY